MLVLTEAVRYLLRRWGRAVLGGLGITATLAVVVFLSAMTAGTQASALRRFEAMGLDRLWLVTDPDPRHGLSTDDAAALAALLGETASTAHARRWPTTLPILARGTETSAEVYEVNGPYAHAARRDILIGRQLLDSDLHSRAPVCVVTPEIADALGVRVGDALHAMGDQWRIVGVMAGAPGTQVVVPDGLLTQGPIAGPAPVDRIELRFAGDDPARWSAAIGRLMRHAHPLGSQRRFGVVVPVDLARAAKAASHEIGLLETAIGVGGLTLGSLCLAVAMIASVRDRQDEFGLRLMLGATARGVLAQIALETLVIALLAGGSGIMAGLLIGQAIAAAAPLEVYYSPRAMLVWVAATTAFGTLAALAPAWETTRINPARLLGASA